MKVEEIIPNNEYVIKTDVTGQFIGTVDLRNRGDHYPFETSAANFGLLPENILYLKPDNYFLNKKR